MNGKRSFLQCAAAAPHIVWSVLFIIAPLIFVVYYSFTDSEGNFTLDNIKSIFNEKYIVIFLNSFTLAVIATFICLITRIRLRIFFHVCANRWQKYSSFSTLPLDELPHNNVFVDDTA